MEQSASSSDNHHHQQQSSSSSSTGNLKNEAGGTDAGSSGGSISASNQHFTNNDNSSMGDGDKNGLIGENGFIQPKVHLNKSNQDIVRLIGQYLLNIGLDMTANLLVEESGCSLEHPSATKFRQHVMSGDWTKAETELKVLQRIIKKKNAKLIFEMKFLILEQKYLEFLEDGRPYDALHVLRNELTPLQYNLNHVHQLSSHMICSNNNDLYKRANWEGKESRIQLMERLQACLPSSVMLPPRRLRSLLNQAVELQTERCICHQMAWETNLEKISLLSAHSCSNKDGFPMQTSQILTDHCDEVWFCKFSPDGLKLATGSKDCTVKIYDIDPIKLTLINRHSLDIQLENGVAFFDWSPDSKLLLIGGEQECSEIYLWNIEEGKLITKFSQGTDYSLTCGAFNKDGTTFVTGGIRGQFYLCDLSGNVLEKWIDVDVIGLAFRADNKTILAADTDHRIGRYVFGTPRIDFILVQENDPIMTFCVNSADRLALLNIASEGLHLWDLDRKCLVRRFEDASLGNCTIHSCFGGLNENYVASGSEDFKVYIWHIKVEKALAKLIGHTKLVNCVTWNPIYPILASASDDGTVRIWGPKSIPTTNK